MNPPRHDPGGDVFVGCVLLMAVAFVVFVVVWRLR